MSEEQEIKKEMNNRELPDSITMGSAAKGVALKVYTDMRDLDLTKAKADGLLATKAYLVKQGIVV